MMKRKNLGLLISVAAFVIFFALPSSGKTATDFPKNPINIICTYAPGASYDMSIRVLANGATKALGQPVMVENLAGGGGFVANAKVYNAAPDGYTLILNSSSTLCLAPHLRKAPFDPWKLTPIMSYGIYPILFAVKADSPWNTFKDFIEEVRKRPGEIKLAASGPIDAMDNLPMLILKRQEKLNFDFVPYEGGAPAAAAVLGGHVPGMAGGGGTIVHIKSGALRGLVAFTSKRISGLPDIPTAKELGYDITAESRYAIYGPPGVPKDIVTKLSETFKKAMETEEFKKVAETFKFTISFSDANDLDKYHRDLSAKIRAVLVEIGKIKE
jgi:tripartite-type tricarboxylate transporter receptor subunit TctC